MRYEKTMILWNLKCLIKYDNYGQTRRLKHLILRFLKNLLEQLHVEFTIFHNYFVQLEPQKSFFFKREALYHFTPF